MVRGFTTDRRRLATLRLAALGISRPASNDPVQVVRELLAVQAQDYEGALWAIGLRTAAASRAEIEAAHEAGAIVRSWPMRGTLHFVAAEDLGWMLTLTAERILRSAAGRHRQLELGASDFDRGAEIAYEALHGGRSAYHHVLALAQSNGIGRRRVEEVLGIVGLTDVARRRAGTYSLGMRQRLGLAAALLGDPGIVLCDEPVNGLDADGIIWIRELLRDLADEGRTIFVSSHLMSEVAMTATDLVVIGGGRLVAIGQVAPDKTDVFLKMAREIAAELVAQPVSGDELQRVLAPTVQALLRASTASTFWLRQLAGGSFDQRRLDAVRSLARDYGTITPAILQDTARKYLRPEADWTMVVVPQAKAAATPATTGPAGPPAK